MSFVSEILTSEASPAESTRILTCSFATARGPPLLYPTTVNKRNGGILMWA